MRRRGLTHLKNKIATKRIITISALLFVSACSPLANRLVEPASSSAVYPLNDSIVTHSIPSRTHASYSPSPNYEPSRRVTSRSLAPIETYPIDEPVVTSYREPTDGTVIVRSGDTLLGVAREHGVDAVDLAELNTLEAPYSLRVGDELVLPGSQAARKLTTKREIQTQRIARSKATPKPRKIRTVAIPTAKPKRALVRRAQVKRVAKIKNKKVAKVALPHKKIALKSISKKPVQKPVKVARIEKPLVIKKPVLKTTPKKQTASVGNKFRWPVRGRVISEFGSKSNGAKNDGINLSVPKGAAIVAAENGLVVYSGNELKGYGNLVLIRHSDGWSTAYAHISEMLVKKGQTVRRGQVIAKAGQTGSVSRPQLHFELRRGTNPVNPRKYLSGAKVASR